MIKRPWALTRYSTVVVFRLIINVFKKEEILQFFFCFFFGYALWCCLFTSKSTTEGQTLARKEHNILGSAKCGKEKLYPKGKLPLRGGELQLRGDFSWGEGNFC